MLVGLQAVCGSGLERLHLYLRWWPEDAILFQQSMDSCWEGLLGIFPYSLLRTKQGNQHTAYPTLVGIGQQMRALRETSWPHCLLVSLSLTDVPKLTIRVFSLGPVQCRTRDRSVHRMPSHGGKPCQPKERCETESTEAQVAVRPLTPGSWICVRMGFLFGFASIQGDQGFKAHTHTYWHPWAQHLVLHAVG